MGAAPLIVNARMYAVTPAVEAAWRAVLDLVLAEAGVTALFDYLPYPAPRPLELLWRRPDLGCVLMCGFPIATGLAEVTPIAAPIPAAAWAGGKPVYRTDLIVAATSPLQTLADTFGGRAGWTVAHSHSGFNAFRHHLLGYRRTDRPVLYGAMTPNLVTARAVLDQVANGMIDVGPLDAYWHELIARALPDLAAQVRMIESTATAPMPAFVAGPAVPADVVDRLRTAFVGVGRTPAFEPLSEALSIKGFAAVDHTNFGPTRLWDAEALAAGYPLPA